MPVSEQGREWMLQNPVDTSASDTCNSLIIILGYILHCYLGDLNWDLPAVGYSAALGAEAMPGC